MDTTVYTTLDLSNAVSGDDYDYIYLGANIQISIFGMTINPNKTSLVIDGFHDNVVHTLEDANVITDLGTIGIRSASNITVTFKNMNMTGRNYFGMPFVSETPDTSGVTVIYENVTYTGPQITYNPKGLTRYKNCDITIEYPSATGRVQEVGEVNRVEFEGTNTITHTDTDDSVFWFRGEIGTAYFKVLQDSNVTINTTSYFMYNLVPAVLPYITNPVAYELEPGASFTLTSHHGISYGPDHWASSFLIDTDASFRYIQETTVEDYATLYLSGAFTVNEGASVYMQANFTGAQPLISFIDGDEQISIDNPKSFVLYNSASSVITVEDSNITRPFIITGGQLNQWDEASPLPDAGGFEDEPDLRWHRPSWNSFSMTGSVTSLSTSVSSTTFTPEELADLPDPDDFSFQDARVVSIGNLPIIPDFMADDGRPIRGQTEPGADIIVSYAIGSDDYSFEQIAGLNGEFMVFPGMSIPAGTIIKIESNTPFLVTAINITVTAAVDSIVIQRTPDRIAFRLPPISTSPDVLLRRVNPSDAVEVLDLRSVGTRWELTASISGPLVTADGEVSGNAVIFKDINGTIAELSTTPVAVYEGGPATGQTNIIWPEANGILVKVTEPIHSGVEYSTELRWELQIIE